MKELTKAAKHSIEECTKAAKTMTAVYMVAAIAVGCGATITVASAIKTLCKKG